MAADSALVMARPTASKFSVFIFLVLVFGLYTDFSPRGLHPPENFFAQKIS
jgi:hypothetical protein